jgi:hypothetical protein
LAFSVMPKVRGSPRKALNSWVARRGKPVPGRSAVH